MILTNELHGKHPFAGQNTQQPTSLENQICFCPTPLKKFLQTQKKAKNQTEDVRQWVKKEQLLKILLIHLDFDR